MMSEREAGSLVRRGFCANLTRPSDIADNGTTSIVRLLTRDDQLSRTPNRWCRSIRRSCPIRPTNLGLVSSFRLCYGLLDFSAAVRALVDEVDCRHAPVGLDVSYVHRKS